MNPKAPYPRFRTRHPAVMHHLLVVLALLAGISQMQGADVPVAAKNTAVPSGTVSGPSSPSTQPKNLASSDQEITRTLLSELLDTPDRSIVKRIKIRVSNGKVTLSGLAKNEKQKEAIVAMAARAVGTANVEDKIQLRK